MPNIKPEFSKSKYNEKPDTKFEYSDIQHRTLELDDKPNRLLKNDKLNFIANNDGKQVPSKLIEIDAKQNTSGVNLKIGNIKSFKNKHRQRNNILYQHNYNELFPKEYGKPKVINGSLIYAKNSSVNLLNQTYKTTSVQREDKNKSVRNHKKDSNKLVISLKRSNNFEIKRSSHNYSDKIFESSVLLGNILDESKEAQ